jgi:hypothetical protein
MRLRLLTCAALTALALAFGARAQAQTPARIVFTADDQVVVQFCGFPVQVDFSGRLAVIFFTDDDGNVIRTIEPAAGRVEATVTNLDNGKALTLHPAGPGQFQSLPDGFSFTTYGPWLSFLNPLTAEQGIFLLSGRQKKTFTDEFVWTFSGNVVDLCADLSAL